jgi:inner membrane protein
MDDFVAWLWDVSFRHWWGLAIILIAIEAFAASTFLLWPAFSAVIVGIVIAIFPGLDWRL